MLEALPLLKFEPDILHCMDWTSGLIPVLRELEYEEQQPDHPAARAGTYFCINNLAMQGTFEREILPKIGVPHSVFKNTCRASSCGGKVNFLKAGCRVRHDHRHATRRVNAERIQQVRTAATVSRTRSDAARRSWSA